ncbi:N-alpha-acetyltransferase 20 isoform X7 [Cygnus olor]|uniref:N-alpha-acetyltransferase 20 isoform X7 n=1 Tax=Cygnus olor TaxID=8869 RepID=UPI001ADE0908|nr:N-alpha-acetyltransferase 20 isoform X7 [Cygnus olor]
MDCAVPRHAGSCSSVVRGRSFPEPGRGRAVRAGRRRSPLAASAVAGGQKQLPAARTPAGFVAERRWRTGYTEESCSWCAAAAGFPGERAARLSQLSGLVCVRLPCPDGWCRRSLTCPKAPCADVGCAPRQRTASHRRKALSREMEKELIIPLPHPVRPEDATRTQVLWIAGGKFTVRESKRARVLSAQWSHLGGTELLGWRCVLIL